LIPVEKQEGMKVFAGTVNPDGTNYLKDTTGNRRYWPIECGDKPIEIEGLEQDRDQIWAEALQYYRNRESYWIRPELVDLVVKQQGDKEITDEIEILVERSIWARKQYEDDGVEQWEELKEPRLAFSARALTIELFKSNLSQRRSNEGERVTRSLRRLGFVQDKNKSSPGDGMPRERLWRLSPDKVPPQPPPSNVVNQARVDREKKEKAKDKTNTDVAQTDAVIASS
jgi:predicted P-loop ATPase